MVRAYATRCYVRCSRGGTPTRVHGPIRPRNGVHHRHAQLGAQKEREAAILLRRTHEEKKHKPKNGQGGTHPPGDGWGRWRLRQCYQIPRRHASWKGLQGDLKHLRHATDSGSKVNERVSTRCLCRGDLVPLVLFALPRVTRAEADSFIIGSALQVSEPLTEQPSTAGEVCRSSWVICHDLEVL
jgi:hypothetical protein